MQRWPLWFRLVLALTIMAAGTLAALPAPPGGVEAVSPFVQVHDAHQLSVNGQPWKVKAVQFWMTDYATGPPAGWYNTWVARQTPTYLEQARWEIGSLARANLGANTLRIFFSFGDVTDEDGNFLPIPGDPRQTTLDHLERVLGIAREHGMKYTIVLFDPHDCGTASGCWSRAQQQFVTTMAQRFRNDPALAYWSTVNEINDRDWGRAHPTNPADSDLRLDWNWRIAATLRAHDPNHLVSTSIQTDSGDGWTSRYVDYFVPVTWNPAGRLAAMVDLLTPHSFVGTREPNRVMIHSLRAAAPGKPIVLEETGWPTGQGADNPLFSEEVQAAALEAMLSAAAGDAATPPLAGAGIWMLIDFNGLPDASDYSQPHFGLFWSAYTTTHDPGREPLPPPWARKRGADVVQHYFTSVWPD